MRVHREPNNSGGLSFAASVVNQHDKLAQRERLSFSNGFHGVIMNLEAMHLLWGVHLR